LVSGARVREKQKNERDADSLGKNGFGTPRPFSQRGPTLRVAPSGPSAPGKALCMLNHQIRPASERGAFPRLEGPEGGRRQPAVKTGMESPLAASNPPESAQIRVRLQLLSWASHSWPLPVTSGEARSGGRVPVSEMEVLVFGPSWPGRIRLSGCIQGWGLERIRACARLMVYFGCAIPPECLLSAGEGAVSK
jgi:hypothetical protein